MLASFKRRCTTKGVTPKSAAMSSMGRPSATSAANAATGAGWRRAELSLSLDGGASWTAAGGTAPPAIMGVLATALAGGDAHLFDRAHFVNARALAHDLAVPVEPQRGQIVELTFWREPLSRQGVVVYGTASETLTEANELQPKWVFGYQKP